MPDLSDGDRITKPDRLPAPTDDPTAEVAERLGPGAHLVGQPQHVSAEMDLDGDGEVDAITEITRVAFDTSGDGNPDTFVENRTTVLDLDGDHVADVVSRTETMLVDIDGDGIPDIARTRRVIGEDLTGDGVPDRVSVEEHEGYLQDGRFVPTDDVDDEALDG